MPVPKTEDRNTRKLGLVIETVLFNIFEKLSSSLHVMLFKGIRHVQYQYQSISEQQHMQEE